MLLTLEYTAQKHMIIMTTFDILSEYHDCQMLDFTTESILTEPSLVMQDPATTIPSLLNLAILVILIIVMLLLLMKVLLLAWQCMGA